MILRFPGAKTKLLPLLRPYLDKLVEGQDSFHDAFIGSGAVLLDTARRHPGLKLHANDADAGLVAFWKIVSGNSVEPLCERIRSTRPTLRLLRGHAGIEAHEAGKPRVQVLLPQPHQLFRPLAGRAYRRLYPAERMESGRGMASRKVGEGHHRWEPVVAGRLTLSRLSGTEYVATNFKKPLFIDPPYFGRGDRLYQEKMTFADYLELSRLLRKARHGF